MPSGRLNVVGTFQTTRPNCSSLHKCSRRLLTGDAFRGSDTFQSLSPGRQELVCDCVSIEACTVGMPAEPLEFLERAVKAGHPRGMEVHVDRVVHQVIMENFHQEPYDLAAKRISFFKRWHDRAKQIDEDGDRFLQLCPPHAKQILRGKRLQLWHEILCDLGYTDEHLIEDIAHGFELTGVAEEIGQLCFRGQAACFQPGDPHQAFQWFESCDVEVSGAKTGEQP